MRRRNGVQVGVDGGRGRGDRRAHRREPARTLICDLQASHQQCCH